ncbi:hypothetical protein GXW73_34590, partial [Roseomonas hellenica]|nr:hypothetical protein [Plastoroseomonas hellenica]
TAATAARLLASPRFGARTIALVAARLCTPEAALAGLPAAEAMLAGAPAATLGRAAILAGAVWHAAQIRSLLRGADVAAFVAEHGEAARRVALAHAALAPADPGKGGIAGDGAALLAAWRQALPAPLPDWIAIRLAPELDVEPGEPHRTHAGAILAAIAPEALA